MITIEYKLRNLIILNRRSKIIDKSILNNPDWTRMPVNNPMYLLNRHITSHYDLTLIKQRINESKCHSQYGSILSTDNHIRLGIDIIFIQNSFSLFLQLTNSQCLSIVNECIITILLLQII
jgi:hypothetical protein